MNIHENALIMMHTKLSEFTYPKSVEEVREEKRKDFITFFDKDKIENLEKESYYAGMGKKKECLAYELEWGTIELGSIKGGSKYKYGYEEDFPKIKELLINLTSFDGEYDEFYEEDGKLSNGIEDICNRSREINGFKTGRTVLPKLLSIFYPSIFLPVFNDSDYFLENILIEYVPKTTGLELYLENNFLLKQILLKLDEISEEDINTFSNFKIMDFLYYCFPKETYDERSIVDSVLVDEPEFNALEVEHYQTLIHRNFKKLFPNLKYFDEETQLAKNGQYDTQTVGIMDFLAVDKETGDFIVIELKRRASDKTIGQLARYMGWVRDELCKGNQKVYGIILAEWGDIYLEFALKVFDNVEFKKMELDIQIS